MKVQVDENGYVQNFVLTGEGSACDTEVPTPADFMPMAWQAYRLIDGALTLDADRLAALQLAAKQDAIRARRERECFVVINRGQLWYEGISLSRLVELRKWYKSWLDAPATLIVPERPEWLD